MQKSKFISLEGVEGAGKSTALDVIAEYLEQQDVAHIVTREPGGTLLGEKIRELLLTSSSEVIVPDAELLLIFAARIQHVETVIKPALARGEWVISDRYLDASFAYQGGGRKIAFEKIANLTTMLDILPTDITIFLDVDVQTGMQRVQKRGAKDRFEQEDIPFFQRVRDAYLQRIEEEPQRFLMIDASATQAMVRVNIENAMRTLTQ
ncbi:MAG: dTMP kinase [Pseudomonadota bacterium]